MTNKEKFIDILKTQASDRNIDSLISYLENQTDFFNAPASTKFHLSERGGLLQHSLNVYNALSALCVMFDESIPQSSIAITALLHDLCKANFYKQ